MAALQEEDKNVLKRYSRAIMHLRDRERAARLALGLGAGVSVDLGFPNWKDLVARLSDHADLKDARVPVGATLTIKTQALIQHLERTVHKRFTASAEVEREVRYRWIKLLHEALYRGVPSDPSELRKQHPYLDYYLDLIKKSPVTINYNFDDSIERMLGHAYSTEQEHTNERVYETVWEPSTQFRRTTGVIYHPNGFLPYSLVEGFSDHIVFSEGEYADQLIDVMSGHYATLAAHLTRYTCLFLGLSLSDSTLKHLLRQNVHANPGHPHYYVRYWSDEASIPTDHLDAETLANFDVYGVITLHLTKAGMCSLGRLLSCSDAQLRDSLDSLDLKKRHIYYISGAVGSGKTSVIQHLKSISTLAEWKEPRPALLQKPHTSLNEEERREVDVWVSRQFRSKNFRLLAAHDLLIACDRTPLDPLVFANPDELSHRAKEHLDVIQPNQKGEKLLPGHVILLTASAEELMARAKERHKGADLPYLRKQQDLFKNLFGSEENSAITELSTSSRTLSSVVRAVCKVIHLGEYIEFDLAARLEELARGKSAAP
jgi:hypothetical protein